MAGKRIELDLPDELYDLLGEVGEKVGLHDRNEAAVVAIAEWISQRKAELDDRDPDQKYFINEALDELIAKRK
jgi:metal-responsive CopG/Arc/MetJ family transcriptional regulator